MATEGDDPSQRKRSLPDAASDADDSDADSDRKLSPVLDPMLNPVEDSEVTASMTEEERKLEAKRAYNRANAARARKRVKEQLVELCQNVEESSDKYDKLKEKHDELLKRVSSLSEENQILRRVIMEQKMGLSNVQGPLTDQSETMRRVMIMEGGAASGPIS